MSNVYAKSGRKKSVFYIGKLKLGNELVDTGLTTAEFKANKILSDALEKQVIVVGLPDDGEDTTSNDEEVDDFEKDDYGLPDSLDELKEIADSYGIEYGKTIKEAGLTKKIKAFIDSENK